MPRQTIKPRADGRYSCRYKNKYFYGATQSEALRAREQYVDQLKRGLRAESSAMTVQQYAAQWVVTYKSHLTQRPYNTHVRILDRFCKLHGSKTLPDVTTSHIQAFFNAMADKSQSSINDARDTIKGLFKAALADRLILHDPCLSVVIPKGSKGTHRAIEDWERGLIHTTAHRIRAGVMVMLYAGLRRGEAMALDIDRDVDFSSKIIHVRYAVRFVNSGKPELVDPKTEAGERTVPLLDVLADELRGMHGLLMTDVSGHLMTESAFDRAWSSYITTLETNHNGCAKRWYGKTKEHQAMLAQNPDSLPPWQTVSIRPHDLRHSFCTMLYENNIDLKTAMAWMGHADQSTTLKIYTHLTHQREKAAAAALAAGVNAMIADKYALK